MVDIRDLEMQTPEGVLEEELGAETPSEEDLEELIGAQALVSPAAAARAGRGAPDARGRPGARTRPRRPGIHKPITDRLLEENRQRALGDTSTWWPPPPGA